MGEIAEILIWCARKNGHSYTDQVKWGPSRTHFTKKGGIHIPGRAGKWGHLVRSSVVYYIYIGSYYHEIFYGIVLLVK